MENILATVPDGWRPFFYRTHNGTEIDLVLERGAHRLAVECKASTAPTVARGFYSSLDDLQPEEAFVVAPVGSAYPIGRGVTILPLGDLLGRLEALRT